jgi:polysaccharide export outer membrane protein
MTRHLKIIITSMIIAFLCISCGGPPKVGISEDTIYNPPMPKVEYEYELGPGDVVEIVYHYTPKPDTSEYYLAVGDVLKVEFAYHQDVNRTLTVRPDGNIAMPRKGDVLVIGLTPKKIQEKLTQLYSGEFKDPLITITMIKYNRAIEHLKTAITTAPRGQSKLTTVRPDGYISFPILPDIMARGKTMPQLRELTTKEYSKQIDNLTVTLILKVMKANLVYIMGEVEKPDYYLMQGPNTVSQILSRAGGALDTAELKTVLVITRGKDRRPWGRLLDLNNVLYTGNMSEDIVLNQYDVVFIPKTKIARMNLFVEQYINNMIPSNLIEPYELGGVIFRGSVIRY